MTTQQAMETRPGVPADTFPTRLRLARIYAGDISIDRAALLCGVKPATWSTWERGVHRPPHFDAMVKAIASGLGVDEAWLRDGGPLAPDPTGGNPEDGGVVTLGEQTRPTRGGARAKRRNLVYSSATAVKLAA